MSSNLIEPKQLKRIRTQLGFTQGGLAEAAGVSQSIIAKIESGSVDPSYSVVARILAALERTEIPTALKVSQLMSRPVVSISKMSLVKEAVELMSKKGFSQLPVFDGGRCVGSISEKTILDRAARGESLQELLGRRVREIMDSPFPIVNDDTPLDMVLGLMQSNYGVLVSRGENVTGILTKSDILKSRN